MEPDARRQMIARTHRLGVFGNAGLAALKLSVGSLAGSRALIADGVHGLSDVAMNLGAWVGWRWANKPPDEDHHYGHGNIEALTTLGVGIIVVSAGVALVWTAVRGKSTVGPDALGMAAVGVEVISMAVKFGLARVTGKRGREHNSSILVALSRDNTADVLSSGLIMLAIIGAILGQRWLEPVAAACVGAVIVWHGFRSAREGLNVLMDRAPDTEIVSEIREIAAKIEGVRHVDDVRVHPLGTHLRVDLALAVDGGLEVREGHDIAHRVEDAIVRGCDRVQEVAVHVNPAQ
jgi:cation diffusion facilitator family transporter